LLSSKYNKNLAGAEITFQPDDIHLYSDEPFDIQITIGNAPIDDGYYFTVKDPGLKDLSVGQLLKDYALNSERRFDLDIERYPEFPDYLEELSRYFHLAEMGKLPIDIYVNKCPEAGPLDLTVSARNYLSSCVFRDQSFDYCLLDLVFEVKPFQLSGNELDSLIEEYGPIWVLFWLGSMEDGNTCSAGNEKESLSDEYSVILGICESLADAKLIAESFESEHTKYILTDLGENNLTALEEEADLIISKYKAYESVSIYPPALGVPDGFDARIQMMRHDSLDVIRSLYLMHFRLFNKEIFLSPGSLSFFESGDCFNKVSSALTKETTFSASVVEDLFEVYSKHNDA